MILTAIDTLSGLVMTCMLNTKKVCKYASAEVKMLLMDAGRTSDVILQSDQEPAIMAQVKKIAQEI